MVANNDTLNFTEKKVMSNAARFELQKMKQELSAVSELVNFGEAKNSLVQLISQISSMVFIDELTGMGNRKYLLKRLKKEFEYAVKNYKELSVICLNIDNFKTCNEIEGYSFGDVILSQVGQLLGQPVSSVYELSRQRNPVIRSVADEFVLVLPETSLNAARMAAERLRKKIEENIFTFKGVPISLHLTVSAGIAAIDKSTNDENELLEKASKALSFSKQEGKNCITLSP